MKNIILTIFTCSMLILNTAHPATLDIKISGALKNNRYFLCIYGAGCYSLHAAANGKSFDMPPMDLGNIRKFVITDTNNMQMFTQTTDGSCHRMLNDDQTVHISGHLVVKNSTPYINQLRCS